MADDIDLPEAPTAAPKRVGRLTRAARWVLRLLDEHPVAKLGLAVAVAGLTIYNLVDSRLQRSAEARRGGWAERPRIDMTLGGAGVCQLTNLGPRQLREVTLSWKQYHVTLDPCFLPATGGRVEWSPNEARPVLLPRERVAITYDSTSIAELCANASKLQSSYVVGKGFQLVIGCEARYHRDADLEPFTTLRYAVVEPGCTKLKGIPPFVTGIVGESREAAALQERAWRCLAKRRPEGEAFSRAVMDHITGEPDPLLRVRGNP